MPRTHTAKVTLFSCHASHFKDPDKETSKLFRDLVKMVKTVRSDHVDEIVMEMLNRTTVVNVTPPGELQYDDPNIARMEEITGLRIFWTFAYDPPYVIHTPKTRAQSSVYTTKQEVFQQLQEALTYGILHTMEELKDQGLRIIYTTAPSPEPTNPKETYSLIEIPNPNIYSSNVFDARIVLYEQFGGDVVNFIRYLCSFNTHTRYYISIAKNIDDATTFAVMRTFYQSMIRKMKEVERTIARLRDYSNELAYFSPNTHEVSRSFMKQSSHPFMEHSVTLTGYGLLCGPDMILTKGHGDIQTFRKIQDRELRFHTASLPKQIFQHFSGWLQSIRMEEGKSMMPPISPFVVIIHACNRCDSDSESCACFLDVTPYVQRKGTIYREDPLTHKIIYDKMI
jgi:hypothetical protein